MATTEDIKKCVALAQSLCLEATNSPSIIENVESPALEQMGALLASNCEKLCIGPSFHFYTPEVASNLPKQTQYEASAETSSDEEYDTVIYKGPDEPIEIVEHAGRKESPGQTTNLAQMKVKLAEASAEHAGLLSPSFFLQSPVLTSSTDTNKRNTDATEIESNTTLFPGSARVISAEQSCQKIHKTQFTFPSSSGERQEKSGDTIASRLERVEILDEDLDNNESQWVEWPKKFIESKGFRLGVQPGEFYKSETGPCFYVKLPHLSSYAILVTNNNQVACDLDLYVDGKLSNALRIPAGASVSVDGPQYSSHAFKVFRAGEVPPNRKVVQGDRENGLIKAVFTPSRVGDAKLRSVSDPLRNGVTQNDLLDMLDDLTESRKKRGFTVDSSDQDNLERSLNLSRVTEAVTLLQGTKKRQNFVIAPEMETDLSKQVTLQLRLIASLDTEDTFTTEEIYDLEPPPLPRRS